jgi:hypothetical protein
MFSTSNYVPSDELHTYPKKTLEMDRFSDYNEQDTLHVLAESGLYRQ